VISAHSTDKSSRSDFNSMDSTDTMTIRSICTKLNSDHSTV
jgi:hypothetical protein